MLNVLSLFSGIGTFERALENLGIAYNLVGYCEIDKYASKAYSLLHGVPESMNYGDITKIDETQLPNNLDLITYGFPCQDISIAGEKKGLVDSEGKKTRSGLFFDALRIIEATSPKIAIAENVKHLTSKSMKPVFDIVLKSLEEAGYNNYWQVMNCADYELPQSRERVLIVSIRKDVDDGKFSFPATVPLTTCMGDYLDDEVPEQFYLSEDKTQSVMWLSCNDLPAVKDKSLFASDRVRVIEFNRHFTDAEQDKGLKDYFESQEAMKGIFTWLVAGYFKYRRFGLKMSDSMKAVVRQYEKDNDLVLQYLEEKCQTVTEGSTKAKTLYDNYKIWCKSNGYYVCSMKKFNAEVTAHPEWYAEKTVVNGVAVYRGITMKEN